MDCLEITRADSEQHYKESENTRSLFPLPLQTLPRLPVALPSITLSPAQASPFATAFLHLMVPQAQWLEVLVPNVTETIQNCQQASLERISEKSFLNNLPLEYHL